MIAQDAEGGHQSVSRRWAEGGGRRWPSEAITFDGLEHVAIREPHLLEPPVPHTHHEAHTHTPPPRGTPPETHGHQAGCVRCVLVCVCMLVCVCGGGGRGIGREASACPRILSGSSYPSAMSVYIGGSSVGHNTHARTCGMAWWNSACWHCIGRQGQRLRRQRRHSLERFASARSPSPSSIVGVPAADIVSGMFSPGCRQPACGQAADAHQCALDLHQEKVRGRD